MIRTDVYVGIFQLDEGMGKIGTRENGESVEKPSGKCSYNYYPGSILTSISHKGSP